MRVQVYYNLHKRCLSIRHRGKVIKHAKSVILRDASFRVQPAGRERVLKQKRKNVHAYVAGELVEDQYGGASWDASGGLDRIQLCRWDGLPTQATSTDAQEVAFQSRQHDLCLGVSETTVEFDHLRSFRGEHQPGV